MTSVYIDALTRSSPQNLNEAVFIHDPDVKEPRFLFVLRAYCIALVRGCQYVNELMKEELYYEVSTAPFHCISSIL